jgi:hypothetical protein
VTQHYRFPAAASNITLVGLWFGHANVPTQGKKKKKKKKKKKESLEISDTEY